MSILSDSEIIKAVEAGDIFITDFNPKRKYNGDGSYTGKLNPNGYNLSLNNKLLVYKNSELDMKNKNEIEEIIIPEEGYVLQPGVLYLGKTNEYTKTSEKYCPFLEGRSSTGRLGMAIHVTAGAGDAGFCGNWTLEITVVHPLRIYPNTEICQIMYHQVEGEVLNPYRGKYYNSKDVMPSKMYMDEKLIQKEKDTYTINNYLESMISELIGKIIDTNNNNERPYYMDSTDGLKTALIRLIKNNNKIIELDELLSSQKITINLSNISYEIDVMRTNYNHIVVSFSKFGKFYLFDYNQIVEKLSK